MKKLLSIFSLAILLISCTSFPETVRKNKVKFIQLAQENTRPVDTINIINIYEAAQSNQTERKMEALGIDRFQTIFADSIVVFEKSNYRVIYDFALQARTGEVLKKKTGLQELENIETRLFLGKN